MQILSPRATLLIIDVQQGFDDPVWGPRNNPRMEDRVAELLDVWRSSRRPVIHVQHLSTDPTSPLRPGQPGNGFKPQARPRPGEPILQKRVHSGFIGTTLESDLLRLGCNTLIVAGLTTNHCVSTTTRMASDLGFHVHLVADATAAFDRVGPDGITYPAQQIHATALCDLHREFATVVDTRTLLAASRRAS